MNLLGKQFLLTLTLCILAAGVGCVAILRRGEMDRTLVGPLPRTQEQIEVVQPNYGEEVRTFDAPLHEPVRWTQFIVNAGWGEGRGGPERTDGWLDKHWTLIDYIDRSADYTSHDYLKNRGIWFEVYGNNEYQETIHFHEKGARQLFWDNGIARDMFGERVLSADYNMKVDWWAKKVGWEAFIVCNNAPRWWSVINYDLLTSSALGCAMSQDNIGGPICRIGDGSHGRYCDFCNAKFLHHLETTNRLPEFRQKYKHIRDYVQANMMDLFRQLPPYNVKERWSPAEAERIARVCDDPVMAEYMKFLYLSHIHNFIRYYQDQKVVAKRLGKHYSVHGNQGGGFMGPDAYQIALSDFVDTVWFESAGQSTYDMFKYHWNNCWGAFRFEIGRAMLRGRKPLMCMTSFQKLERDLVEHEIAEPCAGGGVLFVAQYAFAEKPDLLQLLQDYFVFRHNHRAIFANHPKQRYCNVALVYSIPTMMYRNYQAAVAAPPVNALSGMARALEEGHIPFDVAILNHSEIHSDYVSPDELKRYRLLILPEIECLSDEQVEKIGKALDVGVTVGVVGNVGNKDENNLPRKMSVVEGWKRRGKVVDLIPTPNFTASRTRENDHTLATTRSAIAGVRRALSDNLILNGDLPRLLWAKTWIHEFGVLSLHFVNYDINFETGKATPTSPIRLTVRLPEGITADEAQFLVPGQEPKDIAFERSGGNVTFDLPSIRVYGVVLIGKKGLDATESRLALGDAMMERAKYACDGEFGQLAGQTARIQRPKPEAGLPPANDYAETAEKLIMQIAETKQSALIAGVQAMADIKGTTLALDFGGKSPQEGWRTVTADTAYNEQTGFGWLPNEDRSIPTPEELYYAGAEHYSKGPPFSIQEGYAIFWPYKTPIPEPIKRGLCCGGPRHFRVNLDNGLYEVRIVTLDPSWTLRNYLVSGMVTANGASVLMDTVHDKGSVVSRSFAVEVGDGKLDLTFGGPTGWGVSAVVIRKAAGIAVDPLVAGAIRKWKVSPRYANPGWYPIFQTRAVPERKPARPESRDWFTIHTPTNGIGLVDLGDNREAEVGDVVYATAEIESDNARDVTLHIGASSAATAWLNGRQIAYLPNQKGVLRDEFVGNVALKPGRNLLLLKLCRFWERRWMFYASVEK